MFKFRTLLSTALLAQCAFTVETKSWLHDDRDEFEKGSLKNLSLRSDGRLSLAPAFREVYDASTAYLWALAGDSKGNLYGGGGGPSASTARLFMLDPTGKAKVIADLPGLQIQAIAVDRKDQVYAATTPDGKVYRITGGSKHEVFYDPKAKYIWSLGFNSKGDLFVATGDQGEIHRVSPDGQGSVFFQTEETHARAMAIDAKDNLIVGTEPGGLIVRITPAGEGFVLYQAVKREVTAVAVDRDGTIYAAAAGNKIPGPGAVSSLSVPLPASTPQLSASAGGGMGPGQRGSIQPVAATLPPPLPTPPVLSGGSEVYRIGADGYPQRVWLHQQDIVYAIGFDAAGKPVLGTGNKGNIYRIDSDIVSTLLINSSPTQVTAFCTGARGRLYAATGNVGKLYQIGPEYEKEGTYESEPLDGEFFSYWGRVRFKGEANGGSLRFDTRSGNLDRPQKNWSSWEQIDGATGRPSSPSARFLQYRITLTAGNQGASPELREIELAYMAKNAPPAIEEIDITPPNYKFPAAAIQASTSPATINLPPLGARRRPASTLTLDSSSQSQAMQFAKGSIGARWAVSDPNGDELVYKVELKGVQEREWKLLRDKLRDKFLSWESSTFPDGEYVLRVTAADSGSNPPEQVLTAQLESERFIIDNTPPQIMGLAGSRTGKQVRVRWKAKDARSTIQKAEYSLNGSDWVVVEPTTRLSDSPEHDYELSIEATGTEQTIAVRVTDEFANQAVDKVIIRGSI